jgi:hypothetical protein
MAQYFAPLIDTSSTCNLSINEKRHFDNTLNIYPNPFQNEITIVSSENNIRSIQLFDLTGKSVSILINEINTSERRIAFASVLESGVYFIHLTNAKGVLVVRKIIKS